MIIPLVIPMARAGGHSISKEQGGLMVLTVVILVTWFVYWFDKYVNGEVSGRKTLIYSFIIPATLFALFLLLL